MFNICLKVATRSSPLALAQVEEIRALLLKKHPCISLEVIPLSTRGDQDQTTSLRSLEKCDFFTREVDEAVLSGRCTLGVHSAKDLPDPLPAGLRIVAMTKGVDNGDSLVLAPGQTLAALPTGARIATSSERREAAVRQLRGDLTFCDVRGTIQQRLALLKEGVVSGVVIAEAALIRLQLTHLNRIRLPGPTTALQGRLAIVARSDDLFIAELFQFLDAPIHHPTYRLLHVGLTPPANDPDLIITHCPLIATLPVSYDCDALTSIVNNLPHYTHYIFTSKSAVRYFFECLAHRDINLKIVRDKHFIAVGQATANVLQTHELKNITLALEATAEGVCSLLTLLDLTNAHFLWPHSALSRRVIPNFLDQRAISWDECILYNTKTHIPEFLPNLDDFDEIFFSSPSSIDAFCQIYGFLPIASKALRCCGPVTAAYLNHLSTDTCILSTTHPQLNCINN